MEPSIIDYYNEYPSMIKIIDELNEENNRLQNELVSTKRDLDLYINYKVKPTRAWKVSHVKNYFGIKGTGLKLLDNFMEIYKAVEPIYLKGE